MFKNSSQNASRRAYKEAVVGKSREDGGNSREPTKRIIEAAEKRETIKGSLIARTRGGYKVDLFGCNGFCPFSEFPKEIEQAEILNLIQTKLPIKFKIIKAEDSVIVSHKKFLSENALEIAKKTFANSQFVQGKVKEIKPYGAFVDVGGADGLLHVSNYKDGIQLIKGSTVKVKILSIDDVNNRLTLTMLK